MSQPVAEVVCLLGGCGLIGYGLLRGSWRGLAAILAGGGLAAWGGWRLIELSAGKTVPDVEPEQPWSGRFDRAEPIFSDPAPATEFVSPGSEPVSQPVADELTREEHAEARVGAYFLALERGGGSLPAYDPPRAHDDFCRAAGAVRRRKG